MQALARNFEQPDETAPPRSATDDGGTTMAFIQLLPQQQRQADEQAAKLFAADREAYGYVANFTRLFAHRPDVYRAWKRLNTAIKANMDLRRYELATLAAARRLRCSYCALAHGKVLRDRFYDGDAVRAIVADYHHAALDPADVAVMDFADQVAADAGSVTADDIAGLRAHGLSDADILDVALAAGARCFFSKVLDAMAVEPDAAYHTLLEPDLHEALAIGRPIAPAAEA
jgi:uncharacterized peroxidase-related enzyme